MYLVLFWYVMLLTYWSSDKSERSKDARTRAVIIIRIFEFLVLATVFVIKINTTLTYLPY